MNNPAAILVEALAEIDCDAHYTYIPYNEMNEQQQRKWDEVIRLVHQKLEQGEK